MVSLIDWHAYAVLAITAITFWLFANERLPVQSTALLSLLALMLLFGMFPYRGGDHPLGPEQFLAGFGNPALVSICFLMMLGHGMVATGALEPFVRRLARLWSFLPQVAFLLMLVFCLLVSAFINDTPVVVLMMPVLVAIAARTGTSANRTLLPMNYAVVIGGMATTIGTSTNLLVVGIAERLGVPPIGLFDFTHIVAIAAAVALPYLWLIVPRLLPKDGRLAQARRHPLFPILKKFLFLFSSPSEDAARSARSSARRRGATRGRSRSRLRARRAPHARSTRPPGRRARPPGTRRSAAGLPRGCARRGAEQAASSPRD